MPINVFGAGAVQTAYVSYLALDITGNSITLDWPTSYVNLPYTDPSTGIHYNVLAASMDVTTVNLNVNTITLPDATQSSVGQNFIITNVGAAAFSLLKSDAATLQVCAGGISYYVQLTDNSTSAGIWTVVTFGAGTSAASADALAGDGLVAIGTKLNTNVPVITTSVIPTLDLTYRAKLIVWTGGVASITLPTIGSVPAGFYLSFNNEGIGQLTITPGEPGTKIDGTSSIEVDVKQSLSIISDGANWWTLGFGQNQFSVSSTLTLDVSASVNVILSNAQAANLVQKYTGALTSNITVFFPVSTNYWYINNLTSGAHTLSVQLAGPLGTAYVIPQNTQGIFYSDGTSLRVAPNAVSLADGSNDSPSLSFTNNKDTGIYYDGSNMAACVDGIKICEFSSDNPAMELDIFSYDQSKYITISCSNIASTIYYNTLPAISISTAGIVTLPTSPLPIGSGGTGQITQPLAAKAILPSAGIGVGSILYFDGTNWLILPAGANGTVLTIAGGIPSWV